MFRKHQCFTVMWDSGALFLYKGHRIRKAKSFFQQSLFPVIPAPEPITEDTIIGKRHNPDRYIYKERLERFREIAAWVWGVGNVMNLVKTYGYILVNKGKLLIVPKVVYDIYQKVLQDLNKHRGISYNYSIVAETHEKD